MKALLDTNIIIHRETPRVINQDIGILFKWLDKGRYTKCIHPITIEEICKNKNKQTVDSLKVKLESYYLLKTIAPLADEVINVSNKIDNGSNDKNDTSLLNEVYNDRVDILVTEDKKIHKKAAFLDIADKVFTIDSFLEKVVSENPELVNYKVLSVTKNLFGEIDINDLFFDSFREDYPGFDKWFNKKADETAYVTRNMGKVLSFLYLKVENRDENYSDIEPKFLPKKRLKIGTFKVVSNGVRLGERFLKIILDNAIQYKVDEIYVTIFEKTEEQIRLINLLEDWGFKRHGKKGGEVVLTKDFIPEYNSNNPKISYPYISTNTNVFLVPIYPKYHTELLPDSYLNDESPKDFIENEPHRNAISKSYICRSIERDIKKGDIIVFYRTKTPGKSAYYTSVITTIGIVEEKIDNIKDENDFILKCRKRSIFTDNYLKEFWNYSNYRPFIIKFLYVYSFAVGARLNRKSLLNLKIISGEENELRGLRRITREQFLILLKETQTNESIIVD
ncbi:PIN domain-containing protein [Saccharicrinis aurantiacus]|uniref:PIN domain-containing protein n=1 Tax=Saccharicrinis aurantiacus TaxID=1849719 RepID=UPI00094FE69D|nr:PIN domain-containing protein [Saccharicrinis aurantiacus]